MKDPLIIRENGFILSVLGAVVTLISETGFLFCVDMFVYV